MGRDGTRAQSFVDRLAGTGVAASIGTTDAVADADLVVCATNSGQPLFDGRLIPDRACVVAVGAYQPERRELDADLLGGPASWSKTSRRHCGKPAT